MIPDSEGKFSVPLKSNSLIRAKSVAKTDFSEIKLLDKSYVVPMATVVYGNKTALFSCRWRSLSMILSGSMKPREQQA